MKRQRNSTSTWGNHYNSRMRLFPLELICALFYIKLHFPIEWVLLEPYPIHLACHRTVKMVLYISGSPFSRAYNRPVRSNGRRTNRRPRTIEPLLYLIICRKALPLLRALSLEAFMIIVSHSEGASPWPFLLVEQPQNTLVVNDSIYGYWMTLIFPSISVGAGGLLLFTKGDLGRGGRPWVYSIIQSL